MGNFPPIKNNTLKINSLTLNFSNKIGRDLIISFISIKPYIYEMSCFVSASLPYMDLITKEKKWVLRNKNITFDLYL